MTDQPDYSADVPNAPVHEGRNQSQFVRAFTVQQLTEFGRILIEQFLQKVVQAVAGVFIPGGGTGFDQLADWAGSIPIISDLLAAPFISDLLDVLADDDFFNELITNPVGTLVDLLLEVFTGIPVVGGLFEDLADEFDGLLGTVDDTAAQTDDNTGSILDIFGLFGGATGAGGAGSWITDLLGLIGNPTGLGGGSPTLPGLGSIPLLGPVLGLFGGASNSTQANNFVTNLLSLIGGPTGMTTGSATPNLVGRIPIIGGLLNGIFGGFTSILDQDADQVMVGDASAGIAASMSGQASDIAQLATALSPGNPDSDAFEFSNGSSWGANWAIYKSGGGTASVNGHDAVYTASYGADEEIVARRTLKVATGPNQSMSVVLASASGTITDGNAAVDLWLRCTAFTSYATRTGLRFRFWGDKTYQLHWFNSGTATLLASGSHSYNMPKSATLTFQAGVGLVPRQFLAKVNGQSVMDFTEVGTTSGLDGRSRCVGLRGEFSLIFLPPLEMQPAKLQQWTATG